MNTLTAALTSALLLATPATADEMSIAPATSPTHYGNIQQDFVFTNSTDLDIEVAFEDGNDPAVIWPGVGKAYTIRAHGTQTARLNVFRGQYICYGAWNTDANLYWGSGFKFTQKCDNCCTPADGTPAGVSLTP